MSRLAANPQLRSFRDAVRAKIEADLRRESEQAAALRAQVVPAVARALERARAEGACGQAWLFGSFVWGDPGERSDVDVLVEGCADSFSLAAKIGRTCEREVHVIQRERAPDSLVRRVLADGTPL